MRGAHARRRRGAPLSDRTGSNESGGPLRSGAGVMQVSFAHTWDEDEAELRLRVPLGTAPRASLDVYGAPAARSLA